MEIEMFFAKYDDNCDGVFNLKEENIFMSDITTDMVDSGVKLSLTYPEIYCTVGVSNPFYLKKKSLFALKVLKKS